MFFYKLLILLLCISDMTEILTKFKLCVSSFLVLYLNKHYLIIKKLAISWFLVLIYECVKILDWDSKSFL